MSRAPRWLSSSEFHTTYGISLLADVVESPDKAFLVALLQPVAEHYRDITLYALRVEVRHVKEATDDGEKFLRKLGIKDFTAEVRHKLELDALIQLFTKPEWIDDYGGDAWGEIAKTCKVLESLLPVTKMNLTKVISSIDRLNDLEHNNALYLSEYSEFDLLDALETKARKDVEARTIFSKSCPDVRKVASAYRGVLQ